MGYMLWQAYHTLPDTKNTSIAVDASSIRRIFQEQYAATSSFFLDDYRQTRAGSELKNPKMALPHSHLYSYAGLSQLYRYVNSCKKKDLEGVGSRPELQKLRIWMQYVC